MRPRWVGLVESQIEVSFLLMVVETLLFAVLAFMAGFAPNLGARITFWSLTAIAGFGVGWVFVDQVVRLRRDLKEGPVTERCRLRSALQMPRSQNETWDVVTPTGKRGLINLSNVKGEKLRGRTLLLTYTRHANLLIDAKLLTEEEGTP